MRLSTIVLTAAFIAVFVVIGMLMVRTVSQKPATTQGAMSYNAVTEEKITGVVQSMRDFACPESKGEMGSHLILKTSDGLVQVHLISTQAMRHRNLVFAPGDQVEVVGSRFKFFDRNDLIAREIIRDNQTITLRDLQGNAVTTP